MCVCSPMCSVRTLELHSLSASPVYNTMLLSMIVIECISSVGFSNIPEVCNFDMCLPASSAHLLVTTILFSASIYLHDVKKIAIKQDKK